MDSFRGFFPGECYKNNLKYSVFKYHFILLQNTNEWRTCFVIEELMIQYIYPRLDINVTTVLNHLLRCPFSPHNRTKKVCLPFDIERVDDFDPTTSPDISSLFEEAQLEKEGKENNLNALKKFRSSIFIFRKFVDGLEKYKLPS